MLDISFSELLIIIFVFIVIVSPKNIPSIARAAGRTIQKAKVFMADIKEEIEREDKFKELKKNSKRNKKEIY